MTFCPELHSQKTIRNIGFEKVTFSKMFSATRPKKTIVSVSTKFADRQK